MYISIFSPLANFDGIHYLDIASRGYVTEGGFFPLYPLLIKLFGGSFYAGLGISLISLVLAIHLLYKLLQFDYNKTVSKKTLLFLFVFPTAFFFVCVYTESLFLSLLVLCFYFARQKKWWWAAVVGILLAATRVVGILILPALLYEFWKSEKPTLLKLLPFAIIPAGLLIYGLYCLSKWGSFFFFLHAHEMLGNNRSVSSLILFPQTVWRYLKIFVTVPSVQHVWFVALLELGSFFVGAGLIYLAWRAKVRTSYLIFSVLAFLVATTTGTFSGLPRYLVVLFPLFIPLGLVKNKLLNWSYVVFSGILLIVLFMLFSQGNFIA